MMTPAEIIDEVASVLGELESPPDKPDAAWRLDLADRLVSAARDLTRGDPPPR